VTKAERDALHDRRSWVWFGIIASVSIAVIAGHSVGVKQGFRIGEAAGQRVQPPAEAVPLEVPAPSQIPSEVADYLSADCDETTILSAFWAAVQFSESAKKWGPTPRGSAFAEMETSERLRILTCLMWWR